jgi:L-glutamine:2-deoxy-scyllo-inosose/3-amino-2,3-dideoxy-scyllo-inosose aminotransferase
LSGSDRPVVLGGVVRAPALPAWPVFGREERDALLAVLDSGRWAYEGDVERRFERRFAALQGATFACCVTNGTTALQLAYEALDLGPGDEVIVPGLTWQATAAAVVDVNAVPVLVDVEADTYCIDPAAVEAAVTPRTRAVVAVHLYGSMADLPALRVVAARHGLHVVEDCAHAHGACWGDRGAGLSGDVGCFSFQSSKVLTAGEGGCVVTDDETLAARVRSMRNCGRPPESPPRGWRPVHGGNHRMTEWQAAVLGAQLDRFGAQRDQRERSRVLLDAGLQKFAGLGPMRRSAEVRYAPGYGYVFRYDQAAFDDLPVGVFRAALAAELGCEDSLAPYVPLNRSPLYQPRTKRRHRLSDEYWSALTPSRFDLPVAETAWSQEAVVLPHPVLMHADAMGVVGDAVQRIRASLDRVKAWGLTRAPQPPHAAEA